MMLSPIKALTWEYLSECSRMLFLCVSTMIAAPLAFGHLIGLFGATSLNSAETPLQLYVNFAGMAVFAFGVPHAHAITQMAGRSRSLPIPSAAWAGVTFLIPIVSVMACCAVTQFAYQLLVQIHWPILTTSVSLGVFVGMLVAAAWWLRDFRTSKLLILPAVLSAWVWWWLTHLYGPALSEPIRRWDTFTLMDLGILTLTLGCSWQVLRRSYSAYRCGEANPGWLFFEYASPQSTLLEIQPAARSIVRRQEFQSPQHALSVMNLENSRRWIIGAAIMIAGFMSLVCVAVFRGRGNPVGGVVVMWQMFSAIAGMLAGQNIWWRQKGGMRPFLATLPLSNRDFGRIMLTDRIRLALVAYGIVVMTAGLVIAGYGTWFGADLLQQHFQQWTFRQMFGSWSIPVAFAGCAALCWIFCGLGGALSLSGRIRTTVAAVVMLETAVVAVMFLMGLARDGVTWAESAAQTVSLVLGLLVPVAGTVFLFTRALGRELVTIKQTLLSAGLLGAACAILLVIVPVEPGWKIVGCCFASFIVMPVPAIPCAIAWDRTR